MRPYFGDNFIIVGRWTCMDINYAGHWYLAHECYSEQEYLCAASLIAFQSCGPRLLFLGEVVSRFTSVLLHIVAADLPWTNLVIVDRIDRHILVAQCPK